ncbi:hypothetical protein CRG98_047931 [Punica granatum]|uniref:Uncharacterized protein n=1 Tax=Punica granatum TaxID=22663 RepID=A0A2I0HIZ2_PUNGR|nr:hypothetical protein CRG98_047931 [Punica granatum]
MEGGSADDAAKAVADMSVDSGDASAASETLSKNRSGPFFYFAESSDRSGPYLHSAESSGRSGPYLYSARSRGRSCPFYNPPGPAVPWL